MTSLLDVFLFVALPTLSRLAGDVVTSLEVASHHVCPRRDTTPARTSNLEFWLVNDDVLPHAALVNHTTASTLPLALDRVLFTGVVLPDVLSPMADADVVNVQSLRTTFPLASDHFQGCVGTRGSFDISEAVRLRRGFSFGLHSAALTDPFLLFLPESRER